ncbi:MAG: hypothetical protein KF692_03045 [Cryobacterium sp.]|nr:hypothetical protein [Cryobacterium sp.]
MTRWARVARGTAAAAVSLFIAAFSHDLAGGALPGVAGIALCLAFSVLICIALVGRRMAKTRLAASITASQAMYHWFFGTLGTSTIPTGPALGHVHDAPIEFGSFVAHAHADGDMLLAHLLAAIATFVILAFGERSMAATARYARALARSLFQAPPNISVSERPATGPAARRTSLPTARRVDHSGLRHRGPPLAALA